jgi:hypothetical protein
MKKFSTVMSMLAGIIINYPCCGALRGLRQERE